MAKKSMRMQSEEIKYICDKRNQRLVDEKAKKAKQAARVEKQIAKAEAALAKLKDVSN